MLGYLATGLKPVFKRKLNAAYEKPTYTAAKAALQRIRAELAEVNASAAASLDEGLEETLTPARRGIGWGCSRNWAGRSRPRTASRT